MAPRRQLRLAAIVLAVVGTALFALYYVFLRTPMAPAFQNIREADASAIVAQLAKSGIPYALANDGHDVLVPQDRAADARVAVAGANVALGGTTGFELFNDSDMGLTEFAQKINFQRAMQGELARTIMAMQGVAFARVHLALPERSIFRASQGAPTSAVTIQMTPGFQLTRQRIDGIRQLIASSVPGLNQNAVAVLDENGDLVSPIATADNSFGAPLDQGSALDAYYQLRAREAVARAAPDLSYDVIVNVRRDATIGDAVSDDRALPDRGRSAMTVLVRTEAPLAPEVQARVEAALTDSLTLRRDAGDTLRFTIGAIGISPAAPVVAASTPTTRPVTPATTEPVALEWVGTVNWGLWIGMALLGVAAILLLRPKRRLDDEETQSFAEQLRAQALDRGPVDA